MLGAGYVLGTWLPLHHRKPGASCNNHKYLQLTYSEPQRRKKNPCYSPTSPPSEKGTDNQEYLSGQQQMALVALNTHWQLRSVWGIYYSTAGSPLFVYPASTLNKEPAQKAMVIAQRCSVKQPGWVMLLIINY